MRLKRSAALLCTLALFASFASVLSAQQQAKRPITHQDYDSWRSITASQISRDGKFVAYAYMPEDGDGEIVVRNIATGVDWRAPRGYRPPAPPPDDPSINVAEFQAEQARLVRPVFTADSRFVVFTTEPTKAEVNKAKKEKKKPEDMPKNGLSIMDLSNGTVTRIERVKTFRVPEDAGGFIAYQMEATTPSAAPRSAEASATAPASSPEPGASPGPSPAPSTEAGTPARTEGTGQRPSGRTRGKKEYGTELVL